MYCAYVTNARPTCYDGEGTATETPPAKVEFSAEQQAKVNALLADERRKAETKSKSDLQSIQAQLEEALQSKTLAEEDRTKLKATHEDTQKRLRTEAEQLAHEKKRAEEEFKTKYTEVESRATAWEQRFKSAEITRSLQDAAIAEEAYNPTQIVSLLRHSTKMTEEVDEKTNKPTGNFMLEVEFEDVSTEGASYTAKMPPAKAVKRMKELPQYANLFKSGVVSGLGGNSTAGGAAGGNTKIDLRNLTPEQYRELRKNNPKALGLA